MNFAAARAALQCIGKHHDVACAVAMPFSNRVRIDFHLVAGVAIQPLYME
jgi:hypothetical protein